MFDTLTASEQSCISGALEDALQEVALVSPVVSDGDGLQEWEESLFSCLASETARTIFLSILVTDLEEVYGELSEDQRSCLRYWVKGRDAVAMVAAMADKDAAAPSEVDRAEVDCVLALSTDPDPDDHGNYPWSATETTVGWEVEAFLDYDGDVDYFVFRAEEGAMYEIDVALGTLGDSALRLYDPDGWQLAYNDDQWDDPASRIIWKAPSSGETYAAVSGYGTGLYALTIDLVDVIDDYGNDILSATAIPLGSRFESELEYDNDVDFFRFQAVDADRYQIDVELLTLDDSVLELYHVDEWLLAHSYDYAGSPASRIVWTAPRSGDYYIAVSGYGRGTYALRFGQAGTRIRATTHGLTRLTDNSDLDQAPTWSPDGSRIAFHSDRDGDGDGDGEIYVMNADGSGVIQLTDNSYGDWYPTWSPDGSRIAFYSFRDGDNEIYAMNADGSGVIQLTNNSNDDWSPAWSPDGSSIAFNSDRDGNYAIYVMNTDGSGVIQLTNSVDWDVNPTWSPDGSRIAFTSYRDGYSEIYVMNADGSGAVRLTETHSDDLAPEWSPDGSRIAFVSHRDGDYEIYVMNADGSGAVELTDNSSQDWLYAWSPDGSRIAFYSDRDGDFEIYVMNVVLSDPRTETGGKVTTQGLTQLTDNSDLDEDPAWSPDGSMIAFSSDRDGDNEIYVLNARPRVVQFSPVQLTDNSDDDRDPSWSPDNSMIAFTSGRDGDYEIYVMSFDGSGVIQLTDNSDDDRLPAWSPDGSRIAFHSDRDGDNEIYVMNVVITDDRG